MSLAPALRSALVLALLAAATRAQSTPGAVAPASDLGTGQRTIELVLIPEPGQNGIQETLVYDYEADGDPMIQAGYHHVSPDLPVRALRDAGGDVQLLMPGSGLFLFHGPELHGGNFRLKGPDFDGLAACFGNACGGSCTGLDCFTLRSDLDPATCRFNDTAWIASVWRDGSTIHGLVHNEYESHGHDWTEFPGGQPFECEHCNATDPDCCNRLYRVKGIGVDTGSGYVRATPWCQTTNLTYAESVDGGATFEQRDDWEPGAFPEMVAHGPYEFVPDPDDHLCLSDPMDPDSPKTTCPFSLTPNGGYTQPSNIVEHPTDGHWYAIVRQSLPPKFLDDHPGPENLWGEVDNAILIRTDDLSDPQAWRAFGGQFDALGQPIFDVHLVDPYRDAGMGDPIDHVGYPLNPFWQYSGVPGVEDTIANFAASLTWNSYLEKWVLIDSAPYLHYEDDGSVDGRRGVFFSVSDDLVHWSERKLTDPPIWTDVEDRPMYPALIDHDSPSPNFDVAGERAYLYVQREYEDGASFADLFRQRVEFRLGAPEQ